MKRRPQLSVLALIGTLALSLAAAAGEFRAGAAVTDITPDLAAMKVPSSGYGARGPKPMQGVHDPVRCKALVVADGAEKAAIVTCDLVGIPSELRTKVLASIGGLGLDDHNLMMTASHTHSGPGAMEKNFVAGLVFGQYNAKLTQQTADKIAAAVREADGRLAPAALSVATASLPDLVRNRRDPAGSYNYDTRRFSAAYDPSHPRNLTDPALTVIKIDAGAKTIAVLFNFAAHGTVLGADNMQLSADWPGVAQRRIEDAVPGAAAMYVNGAEGDQAPAMEDTSPRSDLEYLDYIGTAVGDAALTALREAKPAAGAPVAALTVHRRMPPGNTVMGYRVPRALVKHFAPELEFQVVRLGDVVLMGAPLEMVTEIGLALKAGAAGQGAKVPLVAGLANNIVFYCATPEDFAQGGYEVGNTVFGKIEAGSVIGEEILLVRQALRAP